MGAKDTMKTFFAAMNEAVVPTRGYGPKTISTPMGPFSWNDDLQTWVNTNNGMQMNNIAFQDMYAMMDYATLGGGGAPSDDKTPDFEPLLVPSDWGVVAGITSGTSDRYWSGLTVGTKTLLNGINVVFSGLDRPITIGAQWSGVSAGYVPQINADRVLYSLNGTTAASIKTPVSVFNGDGLRFAIQTGSTAGITGNGFLQIINNTTGTVLAGITYSLP